MKHEEKLERIHEKYFGQGGDDFAVNNEGEPLKKKGTITIDRSKYDDMGDAIEHELWTDSRRSVQVATNAKRPGGGICNDRLCAVHKVAFRVKKTGATIDTPKGEIRGDLRECPKGHEQYMEGLGHDSLRKYK